MKIMKRWSVILVTLLLLLSTGTPAFAEEGAGATRQEKAAAAAESAQSYGQSVSLMYALVEDGKVTVSGGTGVYSKTEDRALTSDLLYGIGSVSKVYTAAAVMKLAEMGKVSLDSPLTSYIPEFKMADERYKKITPRMLLNHSSGLMGSTVANGFLYQDSDLDAKESLLSDLQTQRLKDEPGAYSVYCNDGFTLAEILVERVSGVSFTEFVHTNITEPLKLNNTFTPVDEFDHSRLAKTYSGDSAEALPYESLGIIGTGGIYASAEDLALFGASLCLGDTRVLTDDSKKAMANEEYRNGLWPEDETGSVAYGLGWDHVNYEPFHRNGIKALAKGGDSLNYHAGLVVLPEHGMAAAVVSSGGVSLYDQMVAEQLLIEALTAKGVVFDRTPASIPASPKGEMPAEEKQKEGIYGSSSLYLSAEIEDNGQLNITIPMMPSQDAQVFHYSQDGFFRDEANSTLVKFIKEKNGETYLWQKGYQNLPGLGQLINAGYMYQKLSDNPISQEVEAVWANRTEKLYFLLNEKYSSQIYEVQLPASSIPLNQDAAGYVSNNKIVSRDEAQSVVRIPGTGGRDGQDFKLFEKDGVEYLTSQDSLFVEQAGLKSIHPGARSRCTILEDGYARWYLAGDATGKTMTVNVPEKGAFYVYDHDGKTVAGSWSRGDTSAVIPEGGYLVFAGDVGTVFTIQMSDGGK